MIARLIALIRRMVGATDALMARYAAGRAAPDAWSTAFAEVLRRMHTAAMLVGTRTETLTPEQRAIVDRIVREQLAYLAGFRRDLPTLSPAQARARAVLYSGALKESYWRGATWPVPLPAFPGDGTTHCRTNCRCRWEIVELDGDGNIDAYWRRGSGDVCQTCVERAERWAPLRIRGGEFEL